MQRRKRKRVQLKVRIAGRSIAFFAALTLVIANRSIAATNSIAWPEGYVVYEGTESPDGRYGVLVPTRDSAENDGSLGEKNYLADLKNHRVLGKIRGADYFEHENHRALRVEWALDSTWCVVQYDQRFGFESISILEPKNSMFVQTDLGKEIDKGLGAAISKKSHDSSNGGGDASTYFHADADRQVLEVRAASTTDPKQMNERGGYYALFQGNFDLRSKKWLTTRAQPLTFEEYDAADTAFSTLDEQLEHTSFATPENKADWLDDRMNEVYTLARAVLPPNRFARLKQEQIEWLKKRDAAASIDEKSKLIEERIKTLQELFW